jgi:hypothetical protein
MMMLLILVLCVWLAREANRAREQRRLLAAIRSHGGWAHFDYEFINEKLTPGRQPWAPSRLRRALGDEYFQQVRHVSFVYDDVTGKRYDNVRSAACDDVLALLSRQPGLKHLYLKGSQATDDGLASLRALTSLEDLYIWDSTLISDTGVENLEGLVNLRNLHLDKSKVTDVGFRHLARLTKLEHLVLEDHSFSDKGLAAVKDMKHLTWLCVGGSSRNESLISDEGLALVADLNDLQNVNLAYSKVTDRGLKHLAGLKKLKILDLEGCDITDEGLAHLSRLDNLELLLLRGTKVSDAGLEHLTHLKKLKLLTLPPSVSKESKRRFQAMMPASTLQ